MIQTTQEIESAVVIHEPVSDPQWYVYERSVGVKLFREPAVAWQYAASLALNELVMRSRDEMLCTDEVKRSLAEARFHFSRNQPRFVVSTYNQFAFIHDLDRIACGFAEVM